MRALPELLVHGANRPATVDALCNLLASEAADLYDRGRHPVLLLRDATGELYIKETTFSNVIGLAHQYCQPVCIDGGKKAKKKVTLPDAVARAYLELGTWELRPLVGITTCPIIRDDGTLPCRGSTSSATNPLTAPVGTPTSHVAHCHQTLMRA
jgi:hypothetical protein